MPIDLEPFFTVAQIRELARAALETRGACDAADFLLDGKSEWRAHREAAQAAIAFCASAIAVLDDPSLWELAVELALAEPLDDMELRASETAGLERLARHRRVESKLEPLVAHPSMNVRAALAAGISATTPRGRALLGKLANDVHPIVRSRAAERLTEAGEAPWWTGKFRRNPYEGMDAAERTRCEPAVEALGELLGTPSKLHGSLPRLAELAQGLPEALAVEVMEHALSSGYFHGEALSPGTAELARRGDAGAGAIDRVCETLEPFHREALLKSYLGHLDAPSREARCRAWLAQLTPGGDEDLQRALADAIGRGWPPKADPLPVLDAVLARKPAQFDWVAAGLGKALERSKREDVLHTRFANAALRGFEGPWDHLIGAVRGWFDKRPDALRPLVEGLLSEPRPLTVGWALARRLGQLHDPARDGSLAELAARLDDQPGLRQAMRQEHMGLLLPRLRPELRAGTLGAEDAAGVVRALRYLQPGILQGHILGWLRGPPTEEDIVHPTPELQVVATWPEGQQPLTEQEWCNLRQARATAPVTGRSPLDQLEAMPEGPLHPDDRAYVMRVVAELRQHPQSVVAGCAGYVLAMCGDLGDLDTLVELEQVRDEDGESWGASAFPHLRQALRERVGVSRAKGPGLQVVGREK